MIHKNNVIDAAIEGLIAGGMAEHEANVYRTLLDKVYQSGYNEAIRLARPCTCHPDDNPPVPCVRQYALTECREYHERKN